MHDFKGVHPEEQDKGVKMQHIWWMLWVWACTQETKKKKKETNVCCASCCDGVFWTETGGAPDKILDKTMFIQSATS